MYIHIVSQFAINPAYTILNSCNFVIHMTDMYLTIKIQHKTVVYLTLNFHPKGESTALICVCVHNLADFFRFMLAYFIIISTGLSTPHWLNVIFY
jgi:hypothetical protein